MPPKRPNTQPQPAKPSSAATPSSSGGSRASRDQPVTSSGKSSTNTSSAATDKKSTLNTSVQPIVTTSETLSLIVVSPACQWRPIGPFFFGNAHSSNQPSSSSSSSMVAKTQEEQLLMLMCDGEQWQAAAESENSKRQGRRHDDHNSSHSSYCQLSRHGRSFLMTQTFRPVRVSAVAVGGGTSSSSCGAASSEDAFTAYAADAHNPFHGAAVVSIGSDNGINSISGQKLKLLLVPEKRLQGLTHVSFAANTAIMMASPPTSALTAASTMLYSPVMNVIAVPPSTSSSSSSSGGGAGARQQYDALLHIVNDGDDVTGREGVPRVIIKAYYSVSSSLNSPAVNTTTASSAALNIGDDKREEGNKGGGEGLFGAVVRGITTHATVKASMLRPEAVGCAANIISTTTTTVAVAAKSPCSSPSAPSSSCSFVLTDAALSCAAPLAVPTLLAVDAVAKALEQQNKGGGGAQTGNNTTCDAAEKKKDSDDAVRPASSTSFAARSSIAANSKAASPSSAAVHPLIAKAQMRASLKASIAAAVVGGDAKKVKQQMGELLAGAAVNAGCGGGEGTANPVTSLTTSSAAAAAAAAAASNTHSSSTSISLATIQSLIHQCIPDDVLGSSAKNIITDVLSRVLTCCLQGERFASLGLRLPKGVLIYDAPLFFNNSGYRPTGKTFMLGAMARTIDALRSVGVGSAAVNRDGGEGGDNNEGGGAFSALASSLHTKLVDAHACVTKEVGGTEKNIAKMLREARLMQSSPPSSHPTANKKRGKGTTIIFLDNLEVIAPPRSGGNGGGSGNSVTDRSLSTLLTELDGVRASSPDFNSVILVAACRSLTAVDAAVRRPGRLDMHIELAAPQADVCAAALAAPLVPVWEGIRLGMLAKPSAAPDMDDAVTEHKPTSSFASTLPSSDIILPSHHAFLAAMGFGNLWLRLCGSEHTIPSSVADARYVARQALFSLVSQLSKAYPNVPFVSPPAAMAEGVMACNSSRQQQASRDAALREWIASICRSSGRDTDHDKDSAATANAVLDSLKAEIARALKAL